MKGLAGTLHALAQRGTAYGSYPVAKVSNNGSGPNKFCLAKLVGRAQSEASPATPLGNE
jgi:hypothetical protein